jgi:hypothetical protein
VKTYAHSLLLQQERLEDLTAKKRELGRAIDNKRLELLKLKHTQLESMKQQDPELERAIAELTVKVRAYEAPEAPIEAPKGMIRLGKKADDGSIVRVDLPKSSENSAASAAE